MSVDPKKRLGRGLEGLLPSGKSGAPMAPREATTSAIEDVHPNRDQPRTHFAEGALDELASRTPVPVVIHCPEVRVGPDIEETAWFVILEATSNALKHGSPAVIIVDVAVADGRLHFAVTDDAGGGADPLGDGLQGLRDRVEALGGDITIADVVGGTKVEGWLPCEP